LQAEAAECGLACVAMIASFHRHRVSLAELRLRSPVSLKGQALPAVMQAAQSLNLDTRALRLERPELRQLRLPCILHWRMNHFVVLERVTAVGVQIADPATGRRKISHRQCSELFTGVALELRPAFNFATRRAAPRLGFADLLRGNGRLLKPLAQLLALSAAIQVFALVTPAYLQFAIDQVVLSRDRQLMILLAVSFGAIAIINAVTTGLRSWCVFYFGTRLNFGWTSALFQQLLRLPLDYFEKRSVGDIQSRFRSLQPIRELVSSRAAEIVVDGLMAATTGIVILLYGWHLAVVVLSTVLLYAIVRLSLFPSIRLQSREQLIADATADTFLLESIRGALTIKNFGIQSQRLCAYRNRIADALDAAARVRRLSVLEASLELAIFSMQNVLVVYVGVLAILDLRLTVGMLVAFLAYSAQFSSRSINLVQGLLQFRLARIHLERIADIVDTKPEATGPTSSAPVESGPALDGAIEVRNIWFRYSGDEQWILRNISFHIEAGECVGISAPSGFGKTTLLKIMIGLLQAASGELYFDGQRMRPDTAQALRRQFGIVMQQDQLLAGSIAQNISAFDDAADLQEIRKAAVAASIDTEIDALPMRYLTLVGDMGDSFSAGQKQRILLARALYRSPRILFLDEATSSLDNRSERRIVTALHDLPVTRVIVAHRAETLAMCDRLIDLSQINQPNRNPVSISV